MGLEFKQILINGEMIQNQHKEQREVQRTTPGKSEAQVQNRQELESQVVPHKDVGIRVKKGQAQNTSVDGTNIFLEYIKRIEDTKKNLKNLLSLLSRNGRLYSEIFHHEQTESHVGFIK